MVSSEDLVQNRQLGLWGCRTGPSEFCLLTAAVSSQLDDSGKSIFTVLTRPQNLAADLRRVRNCAICYGKKLVLDQAVKPKVLVRFSLAPNSLTRTFRSNKDSPKELSLIVDGSLRDLFLDFQVLFICCPHTSPVLRTFRVRTWVRTLKGSVFG